jgi:hypothetical protein
MSSSTVLLSQEFVDLELFKNAVEDWAIEEKFSTRFDKLATNFCVVKCAAEDSCPFSIRCALNKEGFFAVIKLHAEHTCVPPMLLGA